MTETSNRSGISVEPIHPARNTRQRLPLFCLPSGGNLLSKAGHDHREDFICAKYRTHFLLFPQQQVIGQKTLCEFLPG
jgi:hypothetical protein